MCSHAFSSQPNLSYYREGNRNTVLLGYSLVPLKLPTLFFKSLSPMAWSSSLFYNFLAPILLSFIIALKDTGSSNLYRPLWFHCSLWTGHFVVIPFLSNTAMMTSPTFLSQRQDFPSVLLSDWAAVSFFFFCEEHMFHSAIVNTKCLPF